MPAPETYDLRHRVLGRGRTPEDVATDDDDDPDSGHFAVKVDGIVVATGTVRRQRSSRSDAAVQWQIRGMAVEPERRGSGLGSSVLAAILEHVGARGGGFVWCHARIAARSLYERHGFVADGEPFDDPVAGRQLLMHRWQAAAGDDAGGTIRRGTSADVTALAELQFRAPSKEAVALGGSAVAAQRFRAALLDAALAAGSSTIFVLEDAGVMIGFAEVSTGGDMPPARTVVRAGLSAMGLRAALVAALRSTARLKVDIDAPDGGLHLVELQVDPDRRNQGHGQRLLAEVEREARRLGVDHISLTTAIDNPARRLYERCGYVVRAEKRDARYERLTGSPGRVLMLKDLDAPGTDA